MLKPMYVYMSLMFIIEQTVLCVVQTKVQVMVVDLNITTECS